jgi:hypothetical protein
MVDLTDEIQWNPELGFDEQTEECQNLLNALMANEPDYFEDEYAGIHPRITLERWNGDGFSLSRIYNYIHSGEHPENGKINTISYAVVTT